MNLRKRLRRTSYQILPPASRRSLLRRYHRLRGRELVNILHISKTGGTAVKHAVRHNTLTSTHALILHSHEIRLHDIPNGERVVFFLRDPVARFVSAFLFRKRQGQPRYDSPWTPAEVDIFATYTAPNQLALALSSPDARQRENAAYAMRNVERLRRPQSDWIGSISYLQSRLSDILLVGFQESLAADFEQLKDKTGLPAHLRLPADPIHANRAQYDDSAHLEAAAVRNIQDWYAADYALIMYCRTRDALLNPGDTVQQNHVPHHE